MEEKLTLLLLISPQTKGRVREDRELPWAHGDEIPRGKI